MGNEHLKYYFISFLLVLFLCSCCDESIGTLQDEDLLLESARGFVGDFTTDNKIWEWIDQEHSDMPRADMEEFVSILARLYDSSSLIRVLMENVVGSKRHFSLHINSKMTDCDACYVDGKITFRSSDMIIAKNVVHEFLHYLMSCLYPECYGSQIKPTANEEFEVRVISDVLLYRYYGSGNYHDYQGMPSNDVMYHDYKLWIESIAVGSAIFDDTFLWNFTILGSIGTSQLEGTFTDARISCPYIIKNYWGYLIDSLNTSY